MKYEIVVRGGKAYLEGLVDSDYLHSDTLLTRHEGGSLYLYPTEWDDLMYACLFDTLAWNTNLRDGDEFYFRGEKVAHVDGSNVLPDKKIVPSPLNTSTSSAAK